MYVLNLQCSYFKIVLSRAEQYEELVSLIEAEDSLFCSTDFTEVIAEVNGALGLSLDSNEMLAEDAFAIYHQHDKFQIEVWHTGSSEDFDTVEDVVAYIIEHTN